MKSEIWSIDKLKNWDKNPRSITTKDFNRLKRQIQKHGVYKPLIITPDGEVIGGNMRLRSLVDLGHKEAWVSVVDPKTEAEKIEIALSDNDRAGYYDEDPLAELVFNFKDDINLEDYSVDLGKSLNLDELLSNYAPDNDQDDVVPEVPKEAKSKVGDLWLLGNHRLLCGDSTKREDVEKLMGGKKAEISFQSPPYNVGHNLGYDNDNKYLNYNDDNPEYLKLLINFTRLSLNYCQYSFINLQFLVNNKKQIIDYLSCYKDCFVDIAFWKKQQVPPAMAKNVMNSQVECVFVFSKDHQSRAINTGNFHGNVSNFIETNSASAENKFSDKHNATFPVEFAKHFVKNFCTESVLDLFGGSGSTLIACEKINRKAFLMELEPVYIDVILQRWADFTGQDPVREDGVKWSELNPLDNLDIEA